MAEFCFGVGLGFLGKKADRIARKHGAWLVNHQDATGVKRHWFETWNRGNPFDRQTAEAVMADLQLAGLLLRLDGGR